MVPRQMIKQLFPALVMATLACAQGQAQEPARPSPAPQVALTAPVSPSSAAPRSAGADAGGMPVSVRRMADWVLASSDNGSLAFVIIDKKDAEVFAFDAQGQLLGQAPALLGLGVGDDSAPGVGSKPLSAIPIKDRTTPAGRFVARLGHVPGHQNFFWVDYKNNIALHRVVHGLPKDHRLQRLASPTPADNRITFGCINVPVDFFEHTVFPAFHGAKGMVYIMPEVRAMQDFFPNYHDADK